VTRLDLNLVHTFAGWFVARGRGGIVLTSTQDGDDLTHAI
jgi:hypothetical protein